MDLNIKALMERRKQLRQEKKEVAKTLKQAVIFVLTCRIDVLYCPMVQVAIHS